MTRCGSPSFSVDEGKEQWYECDLEEGHTEEIEILDANEQSVAVTIRSKHEYVPIDHRPEKADPEVIANG